MDHASISKLAAALAAGATASDALSSAGIERRGFTAPAAYYVYILVDPADDRPFYVGKGKDYRARSHAKMERAGLELNAQKAQRLNAIRLRGQQAEILIVADGLAECDAFCIEKELIAAGRERLTNISLGNSTAYDRWQASLQRSLAIFESTAAQGDSVIDDLAAACRRMLSARPSSSSLFRQEEQLRKATAKANKDAAMLMAAVDAGLTIGALS